MNKIDSNIVLYRLCKLYNKLHSYKYGFWDYKNKKIDSSEDTFENYLTMSPSEVDKHKCGVCLDTANYIYEFLYKQKTDPLYLVVVNGEVRGGKFSDVHSFVVWYTGSIWVWCEVSWWQHRGVHMYTKLEDLCKDVVYWFNKTSGHVYQIDYDKIVFPKKTLPEYKKLITKHCLKKLR